MTRIYAMTVSAAMVAWALAPVYGAPKPKVDSPLAEAQTTFEHIHALSATIADTAFRLGAMARNREESESHMEGLAALREDVNQVGSDLRSLEAERDSLSEWEGQALDKILPLMNDVANTTQAINTFSSTPTAALFGSSYLDDTAKVSEDAGKVATLLRDQLKLAKTREKELRIEHSLSEASGS